MITAAMRIDLRFLPVLLAAAAAFAACELTQDAGPAPPAWRIVIDGGADDHGEIVVAIAESGIEIAQIPVAIPKGTRENNVARRVEGALERALPMHQYEVDRKGGENVIVSARELDKDFAIRLVRNTVPGTEVTVVRE